MWTLLAACGALLALSGASRASHPAVLPSGSQELAEHAESRGSQGTRPAAPLAGVVAGTVRLATVPPPQGPARLSPYSQRRYRPPSVAPRASGVEDVVLFVVSGAPVASGDTSVAVTQRELRIDPHVTAVPVGTTIGFPNEDEVFHNLFSLSPTKRFDLGRYPPGESRSVLFDKPGIVNFFCDIHSEMAAVIWVLDRPFARPAADGSFQIVGVPAGRHTIVAWHERLPPDSVTVMVPEGGVVQVDFSLGG